METITQSKNSQKETEKNQNDQRPSISEHASSSTQASKMAQSIINCTNPEKIELIINNIEIDKLNQKLGMMSQMPNNNIGLALIFRKFRQMNSDQQKQFCGSIYSEYNKHFSNVFEQILQFRKQIEINLEANKETDQTNILQKNVQTMIDQLYDLIRLTQRIGYNCPIEHISTTFYILYAQNIDMVEAVNENQPLPVFTPATDKIRDPESIQNMRCESDISQISPFLYRDFKNTDPDAEISEIINLPLKVYRDADGQLQVLRFKDSINTENVQDEFSNGEMVDLYDILSKIFLIDGRIYKHYRLLPWFPKYMEQFYHQQLFIMDNNDGGKEEFNNRSENDIFPKYINYYLAIMAVSLYNCEYLLQILQEQFLLAGGPLEWLLFGLKKVDPKIARIAELNEIIAFQPWLITKDYFTNLIKGSENHNENWTIHEVLKASTVLLSYHGMCALSFGMGLKPDIDIIQELLTLMGPEVLQLTISQKEIKTFKEAKNNRLSGNLQVHFGAGNYEGDQSSQTSRSQRSVGDMHSDRIYKYLKGKQNKRSKNKKNKNSDQNYLSQSEESEEEIVEDLTSNQNSEEDSNELGQLNFDDLEESEENSKLDSNELSFAAASANRKLKSQSTNLKIIDQTRIKSSSNEEIKEVGTNNEENKEILKEFETLQLQKETSVQSEIGDVFNKHRLGKLLSYANFDHKAYKFTDSQQFSWTIDGYDQFKLFIPLTTKIITNQINFAFQMTKRSLGGVDNNIDTDDYRNAIVFYLKEIHGIKDDSFKYTKINKLFDPSQKIYIKKLMCNPQDIEQDDYTQFPEYFYDSEKCHVCILAMETKRQVSLLYLAKALQQYLS